MGNRIFMAAVSVPLIVISLICGIQAVDVAEANWFPPTKPVTTPPPTVTVDSPVNGTIYREGFDLDFFLSSPQWARGPGKPSGSIIGLAYKIDDQPEQTIPVPDPYAARPDEYRRTVPIPLSALSDGSHTLKVISYCETYYIPENSTTYNMERYKFSSIVAEVNFVMAVNPQVKLILPENTTYTTSYVAVDFTTDRLTSWIRYSLNSQNNLTIAENITLTNLEDGLHSLTIYANDTSGNIGKSDTIYFTINTQPSPSPTNTPSITSSSSPTQQPTVEPSSTVEPFPIPTGIQAGTQTQDYTPTIIITAIVIVAVVVSLLVYLKKRK